MTETATETIGIREGETLIFSAYERTLTDAAHKDGAGRLLEERPLLLWLDSPDQPGKKRLVCCAALAEKGEVGIMLELRRAIYDLTVGCDAPENRRYEVGGKFTSTRDLVTELEAAFADFCLVRTMRALNKGRYPGGLEAGRGGLVVPGRG